jgi:radical SAM protein with 4Fe4S-binding SPASM domain
LIPTYELLKTLEVRSWKVSATVSVGNWIQEKGEYDLSQKEFFDAYLELIEQYQQDGALLTIQLGGFYFCEKGSREYKIPILKFDGSEKALKQPICRSARLNPYVMADGKLLPCIPMTGTFIEDEMPSLLDTGLSTAIEDPRFFERIDMRLETLLQHNQECDSCEYKLRCGMGCRAQAMIATGNYYGKDPESCFFFKSKYEEKIKEKNDVKDARNL